MKTKQTILTVIALASVILCALSQNTLAQNLEARISTREAYVGMPVILQLTIENASNYNEPVIPEIDGCDVRMDGAPSQSSQIMIINGRRTETRSIVLQYSITPRRPGTFEIPALNVNLDGKNRTTQAIKFVATKSEIGDLMFVEIICGKSKVFVGQPLDLTLKIWLKPFRDLEKKITLSEGNMWQMISEQTAWGSFADRLRELAENNQRPGGKEVLRDDGTGTERSYYLYEINATVYPKRPGKIDADDVQIVVNYPTALGKSPDPFDRFFDDSPFGGNSPLSRMMDNDFFSSRFGNRLSITSVRPIVGNATVDTTEVIPVPTDGRPFDYRGAVGRYKIMTQATPNSVSAGDPITLNIGIAGTGPMELVQAPPLAELTSLTRDFKVADQSLAGFVQGDAKVFSTTIRPRVEGITHIPPIPFSFFDPDTEKFETVMSEPIAISVTKAESLSLDSIVGKSRSAEATDNEASAVANGPKPNFTNSDSADLLISQIAPGDSNWWWPFVFVPPIVWIATLVSRNRNAIAIRLPSFRSPAQQCLLLIDRATENEAIASAMTRYISRRTRQPCNDCSRAVGALRSSGLYQVAAEVESMFQSIERQGFAGESSSLNDYQRTARDLVAQIETAIGSIRKAMVRRSTSTKTNRSTIQRTSMMLLGVIFVGSASCGFASDKLQDQAAMSTSTKPDAEAKAPAINDTVQLSDSQCQTILKEASELYAHGLGVATTDTVEAKDSFKAAAEKYQLLVDSGIHNSRLYLNLGNAWLQSGLTGRAIANYERALKLDPYNATIDTNLEFANALVVNAEPATKTAANNAVTNVTSLNSLGARIWSWNETFVDFVGLGMIRWTLVLTSMLFWGLLIARTSGYRFPAWQLAAVPLLLLFFSLGSICLWETQSHAEFNGVVIADYVMLHSGDGEQFDKVFSIDDAQGHRVEILVSRGEWLQIKTVHGHIGWVAEKGIERL